MNEVVTHSKRLRDNNVATPASEELDAQVLPLDARVADVLRANMRVRGYASNLAICLIDYPDIPNDTLPGQMPAIVSFISDALPNKTTLDAEKQDAASKNAAKRLVSLMSLLINQPLAPLTTMLESSHMQDVAKYAGDHFWLTAAEQFWYNGGSAEGTAAILKFTLDNVDKDQAKAVQDRFYSVVDSSLDYNNHSTSDVEELLLVIGKNDSELEKKIDEYRSLTTTERQNIVLQMWRQSGTNNDDHRPVHHFAQSSPTSSPETVDTSHDNTGTAQRIADKKKLLEIEEEPNRVFHEVLLNSDEFSPLFIEKAAAAFMSQAAHGRCEDELQTQAIGILQNAFNALVNNCSESATVSHNERYRALQPYLTLFIPSLAALNELISDAPGIVYDTAFYKQWKRNFISEQLRSDNYTFEEGAVPKGVIYDRIENIEDDLRIYFANDMRGIAQKVSGDIAQRVEITSVITSNDQGKKPISDEEYLQQEVITPLNEFDARTFGLKELPEQYIFKTKEMKRIETVGATPSYMPANSFTGCGISVGITTGANGKRAYILNIKHRNDPKIHDAKLMQFAAFVGKKPIYNLTL